MSTPAAPQGAPAPAAPAIAPSGTPVPPATPPVPGPPPAAPAALTAPAGQQPAAPAAPPADSAGKTFTQADLDRILTDRLARQEKAFTDKFAQALGITDPNAPVDPAKALETEQGRTKAALDLALSATAESIALAAGIKPERVDTFVALAQANGALKDVNLTDPTAKTALRAALEAEAAKYPEWKGSALPAASGGDRQPVANGKRTYTRAELAGMNPNELAANADDIVAASREGRIV